MSGKIEPEPEAFDFQPVDDDGVLALAAKRQVQHQLATTPKLLAASLGVSERRLSRAFRNSVGTTPFEYVRQERMTNAQRLLADTALSIVSISQELGFSSPANFATAFREYTGMAPSDYRRTAKAGRMDESVVAPPAS